MTHHPVGTIGLECLMNRANIFFTSGYRFIGELDIEALRKSFVSVIGAARRFEYRLHFEAQNRFRWERAPSSRPPFLVCESDDIDYAFADVCRNSLSLAKNDGRCPMAMTVLRQPGSKEFIIAQTSEHTYLDARSSEFIFNRIIDHYNALMRNDEARQREIVDSVHRLRTLSGEEILRVLELEDEEHKRNMNELAAYRVADDGRYAIPLGVVPACLENYRRQRFAPIIRRFPLAPLLKHCRQYDPEVTQNSVICAALAKGFYELNRRTKQLPQRQTISFKMLSDLLSPGLREEYTGNYIAFVPVSVDGNCPVEEIARQIHVRVQEFKSRKIDVSLFRAVEEAVEQGVVGTADDPLSFVVTNWSNYAYLNNRDFLHGCTSLRHQSGVNIDPRDTLGAVLVNRPILVVNLAAPGEVCLSLFPSLRAESENLAIAEQIGEVFANPEAFIGQPADAVID